MKCEFVADNLTILAAGELPEDERRSCMNHIAACEDCSDAFEGAIAMHTMRSLPAESAPAGMFERVMSRTVEQDETGQRFWLGAGFGGAIAASLLAVAFALGMLTIPEKPEVAELAGPLPHDPDGRHPPDGPIAVTSADARQDAHDQQVRNRRIEDEQGKQEGHRPLGPERRRIPKQHEPVQNQEVVAEGEREGQRLPAQRIPLALPPRREEDDQHRYERHPGERPQPPRRFAQGKQGATEDTGLELGGLPESRHVRVARRDGHRPHRPSVL